MTRTQHNLYLAVLASFGVGLTVWIMFHSIKLPRAVSGPMNYEKPTVFVAEINNDCVMSGIDGQMTVIVKIDDAPPAGKVLGVFGKVHYYSGNGTNLDYSVWKFGNTGETHIMTTPVPAVSGIELTFEPGFTNPGNDSLIGWTYRCSNTGCPSTDSYTVCAGKKFVGSFDANGFKGNCELQLSPNMVFNQIGCIN